MSLRSHFLIRAAGAALCAAAMVTPTLAAQITADQIYCFSPGDFGQETAALTGVCITGIPQTGTVCLGSRVIRTGDVLTAQQLAAMTYHPQAAMEDAQATVSYLPIFSDGLAEEATMTISIQGKRDDTPIAEDSAIETYKNLPNEALLKVSDPEGQPLTYTLVRTPRRGEVVLRADGSFLYTPRKNKVGTDSFTYIATDPAGNISREATVTIRILKPTDSTQYTDTMHSDCRFEAEWLRHSGIFAGEQISGESCFSPEEPVTRGQFLTMLMRTLDLPVDRSAVVTGFLDESAGWLKPYLAAAFRSGLIQGYPCKGGVEFRPEQPITGVEAATMMGRALEFAVPTASMDELETASGTSLTRADAAIALYQLYQLSKASGPSL